MSCLAAEYDGPGTKDYVLGCCNSSLVGPDPRVFYDTTLALSANRIREIVESCKDQP